MNQKTITLILPLTNSLAFLTFICLSVVSFIIPFSVGHPQWVVGTFVNAGLFLAVIFLPKKYIMPLVFLPSLGVLSRGLIFGPFTPFLVYFLPFIWLGNTILIYVFNVLADKSQAINFFFFVFFAASAKYLLLTAAAHVYFEFNIVPSVFLQTMGIYQLVTALAGGLISFFLFNIYAKYSRSKQTA